MLALLGLVVFYGLERAAQIGGERAARLPLERLREMGLIWTTGERFGATLQGRLVLNALLADLLSE